MACRLFFANLLSGPMPSYFQLDPKQHDLVNSYFNIESFLLKDIHLKMSSVKWQPFCFDLNVLTMCFVRYGFYICV